MKKAIIIFSFILISIFSIGSFLIYFTYIYLYQNAYHTYIKQNKEVLNTTKVFLNPSELFANSSTITWEDNNNEIIMNGVLYDVISVSSEKGRVTLTVLSDYQEAVMKKEFASTYDASSSKSTSTPIKLLKQFLSFKFVTDSYSLSNEQITVGLRFCNRYTFILRDVYISLETPPPSE